MSGNALTVADGGAIEIVVTPDQIDLIKRTVANEATNDELQLYMYDCKRQGVHPLDKLLHFTKRGGKYVPITSIDLMRSRAHDTGDCAGIDEPRFCGEPKKSGFTATVSVYRLVQGQRCAFTATARWEEYFPGEQQGQMWLKMPHGQLGKCAEAAALRKAFPRQLSGVYESAEMDQSGNPDKSAPAEPRKSTTRRDEPQQATSTGECTCNAPAGRKHLKPCPLAGTTVEAPEADDEHARWNEENRGLAMIFEQADMDYSDRKLCHIVATDVLKKVVTSFKNLTADELSTIATYIAFEAKSSHISAWVQKASE